MNFRTQADLLTYLYHLPRLHPKSDLSYIKRVLAQLGHPERQVKTVHVTGTNGKGSTSYYLSRLIQKAGPKTGLFVSPYVQVFNERIQIAGENISEARLLQVAGLVQQAIDQLALTTTDFVLTTFEFEVAMAFVTFSLTHCEYAVIEVGIGGTHDKTNVIIPECSVITTVAMDHEDLIGPTLADIAREKSGVIKAGKPVVLGKIPPAVRTIILKRAMQLAAPVYELAQVFQVTTGAGLQIQVGEQILKLPWYPLVEGYDIAMAVQVLQILKLQLTPAEIIASIKETVILGRYQIRTQQPLVILDGGHNLQAISHLLTFVRSEQQHRQGKVRVLIGMMKDKDLAEIFQLFDDSEQLTLTAIDYPRAARRTDFPQFVQDKYPFVQDYRRAYVRLKAQSKPNDILLVTGSFYLVSEILQIGD